MVYIFWGNEQPGSISVVEAMKEEVERGEIDGVFHIGDISYATGFLVEWDFFLHLINPIASRLPYMTAIGNHERYFKYNPSLFIIIPILDFRNYSNL